MKKLLLSFTFLIAILSTYAQPGKTPSQYLGNKNNTVLTQGSHAVDSALGMPVRDTTFTPYRIGFITQRPQDATWWSYDSISPSLKYWRKIYAPLTSGTPQQYVRADGVISAYEGVKRTVAEEYLKTWKVQSTPIDRVWVNLAYSPELRLLVAVSHGATSDGVMTSPDGTNWTARTCPAQEWRGVAWSPKLHLFAAVGGTGTGNRVMTSTDGITWVNRTSTGDYKWRDIVWSDEKEIFVAVANTTGATDKVMTSTDGITWVARTTPDRAWSDIVYAPKLGLFVVSATGGIAGEKIMTSPDGTNWTLRSTPGDLASWEGLGYSDELKLFVAVSYYGFNANYPGTRVMTSPDGTNWTLRSTPLDAQWLSVAWSPELGMFAAVADNAAQGVMVSPDGITWTLQTPDQQKQWRRIIWVKELGSFVSCAYTFSLSGVGNLIMMSKPIDREQQYLALRGRDSQTVQGDVEFMGSFKLVDQTQGIGKILTSDAEGNASWQDGNSSAMLGSTGINDYVVGFHNNNAFTDSTLVNNLSTTNAYFDKGLVLNGAYTGSLDDSYLSLWNYGFVASEYYKHRLTFQVLDSSTDISIGIGVRSGQLSVSNKQMTYITGTIGDSSATTAGSVTNMTGETSTGILINKGDYIELTSSMVALDSTVLMFRNLTNGTYKKVVRKLATLPATSTAVMGYPTIYFAKGHVKLINYSLSKPDLDYVFFGNSITAGFYAADIDSGFVGQLKKWTASGLNNSATSGATSGDFLKLKEEIKFKNRIVFLSGIFGNDPGLGISATDSKANYQAFANKMKANNNRIVHIDNPFRNNVYNADILALNRWIDSTYRGIDTIISIDSALVYPTDFYDAAHLNTIGHTKVAAYIMASAPYLFERRYPSIHNQYAAKQTAKLWVDSAKSVYVESTGDALINGYTIGRGAGGVLGNTVFGYEAGKQFTSTYSAWNTAVGYHALRLNRVKGWNTAMGLFSLANYNDPDSTSLPAGNNTAYGANSLRFTTLGKWNTAMGASALLNNTTGINNTAFGLGAGRGITTGSYNTIIGIYETVPFAAGTSNTVALGDGLGDTRFYSPASKNILFGTLTDITSSKLTVESTTQGLLIPRMNTTQQNAISSPANGLTIYNTDSSDYVVYKSSEWRIVGKVATPVVVSDSAWSLDGNSIVSGKFIGTTNAEDVVIKTAGNVIGRLSGDGQYRVALGNGTTASGNGATAMGGSTIASAPFSTAFGYYTTASGNVSVAMGESTIASGYTSFAMGNSLMSKSYSGTVIGVFNDSTNAAFPTGFNLLNRAFQIGIGTANNARNNAMTVLFNGNVGIGTVSPTARLHLKAGSTTASTAPIKLTTGAVNATAEDGALEYTTPQLTFVNGGGIRQEIFQGQHSRVTTQFDKSDSDLSDVTELTANVAAGKTYRFEARLYTVSDIDGGVKAAIGGTATASSIVYEGLTTDAGLTTQGRSMSLTGPVGEVTAVTTAYIVITGTITVDAAGTLTVQFGQAATSVESSVLYGSTFVVTEIL